MSFWENIRKGRSAKKEFDILERIRNSNDKDSTKIKENAVRFSQEYNNSMKNIRKALENAIKNNDFNQFLSLLGNQIQTLTKFNQLRSKVEYKALVDSGLKVGQRLTDFRQKISEKNFDPSKIIDEYDDMMRTTEDVIAQAVNSFVVEDKIKETV